MAERDPRGLPSADELLAQLLAFKLELRRIRAQLDGATSLDPARLEAELRAIEETLAAFDAAIATIKDRPHPADCLSDK
jgi:hypothetical protein